MIITEALNPIFLITFEWIYILASVRVERGLHIFGHLTFVISPTVKIHATNFLTLIQVKLATSTSWVSYLYLATGLSFKYKKLSMPNGIIYSNSSLKNLPVKLAGFFETSSGVTLAMMRPLKLAGLIKFKQSLASSETAASTTQNIAFDC